MISLVPMPTQECRLEWCVLCSPSACPLCSTHPSGVHQPAHTIQSLFLEQLTPCLLPHPASSPNERGKGATSPTLKRQPLRRPGDFLKDSLEGKAQIRARVTSCVGMGTISPNNPGLWKASKSQKAQLQKILSNFSI